MDNHKVHLINGISVIICTYNGAQRLPATLRHLAAQQFSVFIPWEIIIVNNASTDNTAEVIVNECTNLFTSIPFTILNEAQKGKINALYTGVSRAKYSLFIICDDDNNLAPDYLEKMFFRLNDDDRIGAAGGRSEALTDVELPAWFNNYSTHYAVGKQAETTGDVTSRGYLWGAGTGSRTDLFLSFYNTVPSLLTGRSTDKLLAGEDAEYNARLILKGYSLFYDSALRFKHYIPSYRLTVTYRDGILEGIRQSMLIIDKYHLAFHMQQKLAANMLNKTRLLMLTPLRIWLAASEHIKTREKNKMQFLLPFSKVTDQDIIQIRKFLNWV